ncbi:unnamed protein product [Adineta steineri]|uniref:F-box domain-containing protein n=1 Tax=Adineta steineri TaxID=433720 RepID=A0A816CCF6_9BILA|nr:unnamed protein product [Adineta steineri]CAF1620134.1 unnamed protein product [Adineta steineri]
MSNLQFINLPVEIHHCIFDDLDVHTIISSVRCVCKQLRDIVNSYDRFKFKFTSAERSYLKVLSRLVKPSDAISLDLVGGSAGHGCIEVFLQNFNISHFNRFRALTLSQVTNVEIAQLLPNVTANSVISLTVNILGLENNEIFSVIFQFIIQANLQKLDLSASTYSRRAIEIPWPNQNTLEQLTIGSCSYDAYRIILHNSHRLRKMVIENFIIDNVNLIITSFVKAVPNSAKKQCIDIDSEGTVS